MPRQRHVHARSARSRRAEIPYIVEAWVCATTRKGKSAEIEQVFANRTPIVGGTISGQRSTMGPKDDCVCLAAGWTTMPSAKTGRSATSAPSLHMISPFIPLLSIGKRPNFQPFLSAIDIRTAPRLHQVARSAAA